MLYIITEDSNSARVFWEHAAGIYRTKGTYKMIPLLNGGGNTTLKAQIDNAFTFLKHGDELFLVVDNIGRAHNFWVRDLISKTTVRCNRQNIRFTYTKYYYFEELYLSYSELLKMANDKYKDVLQYVCNCLNSGTEYFDKSNLNVEIKEFLSGIHHPITNKEHFANELLSYVTHTIRGRFKIHKSANAFDSNGACWIHGCLDIQQNMNTKEKEAVCDEKCTFGCKNCSMNDKLKHLNKNSILQNW